MSADACSISPSSRRPPIYHRHRTFLSNRSHRGSSSSAKRRELARVARISGFRSSTRACPAQEFLITDFRIAIQQDGLPPGPREACGKLFREIGAGSIAKDLAALRIENPPATLREIALDRMTRAIISGLFELGARVVERSRCEQLGVPRSVIREVIRHLEAEGLVEI